MNRRNPIFVMWPLFIVVMAATAFSSVGAVLCLGEDGHSRLEVVWHPCCGSGSGEADRATIANSEMSSDHCGDCSDYSLLEASRRRYNSGLSVNVLSSLTWSYSAPYELIGPDITNVSAELMADVLSPSRYASVILPVTVLLC